MRNLIVLNRGHITPESLTIPDLHPVNAVFDPVSDSVTFLLTDSDYSYIEVQQFGKSGNVNVLASFPSPSRVISFAHFADVGQLVFVFCNGDILTATYVEGGQVDDAVIELVGSIDCGIVAAEWSQDEETLALVTREMKLLLLSRMFEPITEKELNPDDVKITDSKHVSVGWGKKETQFKGRGFKAREREAEALKHAGLPDSLGELRDPTVNEIERGDVSNMDDQSVRISWRGDCEYFSVSTVEPVIVEDTGDMYDRRVIRVFNREGKLDSVNEPVDGLEHNLSWKPQGSLIASTQRHQDDEGDDVLDLVFYERNGLRHGQFNTRLDPTSEVIHSLQWNCDSEILLFRLQDRVQLWTTKNYHWFLKQELHFPELVTFVKFHPEKPLHLMVGTSNGVVQIIDLAYKITTGPTTQLGSEDLGMTLVVDGTTVKITPLAIANVPPPISFRELEVCGNVTDVAVSKSSTKYAVITSTNDLIFSELSISDMRSGKHPQPMSKVESSSYLNQHEVAKQVAFINDMYIAIAIEAPGYSRIAMYEVDDIKNPTLNESVDTSAKIVLLKSIADYSAVVFQTVDCRVMKLDSTQNFDHITTFPQLCQSFDVVVVGQDEFFSYGISRNGKLFANEQEVCSGVTSLQVTDSHVLFTTVQAKLCLLHLGSNQFEAISNLLTNSETGAVNDHDERIRQIERGSILINSMPSKYSVVLEAPRGNLETICPRIMVLSAIRQFISHKQFKQAFLACRTHRIDLDILHDYDPELFFNNIKLFVGQIEKVEYLDLFVSCLHEEDTTATKYKDTINQITNGVAGLQLESTPVPTDNTNVHHRIIRNKQETYTANSKITKICTAILEVLLEPEYKTKYIQTILTAYACQKPPALDSALELISTLSKEQAESAVVHLCFLQDVLKLYKTALGMYDVKLTLAIAQQSQMDPKEYLPFLQNLHVQPELRRKFLIDDYLKRYEGALKWLFELGPDANSEFDEYVISHELYSIALKMYEGDEQRSNDVLKLYAVSLNEKSLYSEAAVAYEYLNDTENAVDNYVLAKKWKQALSLCKDEAKQEISEKLVSSLTQDHRYHEAAEIQLRYLNNVEEAVKLYCKNYHYDTAILVASSSDQKQSLVELIDVQLGEGFGVIAELLADCSGQMTSQLRRLRELRAKKHEDPYSFYGIPDNDMDAPDDVSIAASETSTTPSFFTRYTGKTSGTAKTGASRRTTKNKKREERKRAKGRKGTIYEEEYLIKSVGRLVERLDSTESDAVLLIEGLVRRGKKQQAYEIQRRWGELIQSIRENIDEIHDMSDRDRERVDDNGEVYLIDVIPKPVIKDFPNVKMLDY
ncbi:Elongator complex protein 1 [Spathaspora sp. JA1]|nr:Elongator complex protein 1 [Spathaspora sp. JA1]